MKDRLSSVWRRGTAILLAAVAMNVHSAMGESFLWQAATTGDWSVGANWTNGSPPTDGADVVITNVGSSVILSGSTSNLNSLTISRTLTFTNWDTSLTATNVTILSGGVLQCAGPFTNNAMSNRVYVVCSNMFIASGGSINVDYKGYAAGGSGVGGHGPGGGASPGGADYAGGGGYGGKGGNAYGTYSAASFFGGNSYGSESAPTDPGSGGGNNTASATYSAGGGAVRIQSSGGVTVNGSITANGGSAGNIIASGASGGGVWISCYTFAATGGIIRANGGTGGNWPAGGGGGGRIAISYDTTAQSNEAKPSVTFSVMRGYQYVAPTNKSQYADIGTLYFPDYSLLDGTLAPHTGRWIVPGSTNLVLSTLILTNGWLRLSGEGFALTVSNDLKITGSGGVLELGGDAMATNAISGNSYLNIGQTSSPALYCGGNLILTNGGCLNIYNGVTNSGTPNYGALVSVTGQMFVGNGSKVLPRSHATNGSSALFQVGSFTLASGGTIVADGLGFSGGLPGDAARGYAGYGPGGGKYVAGGGYGGKGADYSTSRGGFPYGSVSAPIDPGSGGASEPNAWSGNGGGLARIETPGDVRVDGTITANGIYANDGGGSGGGVYIVCNTFTGSNGVIQAGGAGAANSGGGGGRVAVVYTNVAAQQAMAKPRVTFSVPRGSTSPFSALYDMGTIYFPDASVLDGAWLPHSGRVSIPNFTNWSVSALTVTNGWIRFPDEGFQLSVGGDARIVGSSGRLDLGGGRFYTNVSFPSVHFIYTGTNGPSMTVGGNLILTNQGAFVMYCGITNQPGGYGGLVTVTGDVAIAVGSWIYPYSQPTNGGSALFRMRHLTIATNAGFNADSKGFLTGGPGHVNGWGPGGAQNDSGGGYGGRGGDYGVGGGGPTYGSSNAPVDPGSGGGGEATVYLKSGGGLIRIEASGTVSVRGSMSANGEGAAGGWGAGAGGGIYVRCKTFTGNTNGVLRANGGSGGAARTGGGGGRIAVWRILDTSGWQVQATANGGFGSWIGTSSGEQGTVVWGLLPGFGTLFTVR